MSKKQIINLSKRRKVFVRGDDGQMKPEDEKRKRFQKKSELENIIENV